MKLEHIGIAVDDLEAALAVFGELLGEGRYRVEDIERDAVRTHFLWGGSAKLELLEALGKTSPVQRFLERRGGALHHLAFEVDDIHQKHADVQEKGFRPLDPAPRAGADGKLIFFLHPGDTSGILIEFCQSTELGFEEIDVDIPGVRSVRHAEGAVSRPPAVFVCRGNPGPDLQNVARALTPVRALFTVEMDLEQKLPPVLDALGTDTVHLVVRGRIDLADPALEARLRSLVILDPYEELEEFGVATLALLRDDEAGLRRAASLRRVQPHMQLAVTGDDRLRWALIAKRLEMLD